MLDDPIGARMTSSDRLSDAVSARDHYRQNSPAGIEIVMYGDFECPFTVKAHQVVKHLLFGPRPFPIKYAYRYFPLTDMHAHALPAAKAAEAAGLQGKFWEYCDALFELNAKIRDDDFLLLAKKLTLDIPRFNGDFSSRIVEAKIQADIRSAKNHRVEITPVMYVDGTLYTAPIRIQSLSNTLLRLTQRAA